MATHHRKQLPEKDSHHKTVCSGCGPTCLTDCVPFYWPPETPQLPPPPPSTNNDTSTTLISPYLIVIVALIATAILFITYYLIIIRYCSRFRRLSATQVGHQSPGFPVEDDHQPEIDNPIWYITTVGLQPPVINSIRVVKFHKGDSFINYTNCSVCLSEFQDNESVRLLPKCNHAFHIPCIDTWLRSHTNCPLCRAGVVNNNSNTMFRSNDQNGNHGFGLSHTDQMENGDYGHGELGSSHVQECVSHEHRREIQDSKQENATMITLRRSISMDSAAEIVLTDSNSSDLGIEIQSLNHLRDSRDGRMMMMVRSFSFV